MDFIKAEEGVGEIIGYNFNQLRSMRRMNQKFVANRLGMSVSQLKKYESGKESIRLDTAVQAGILFGVPMWRLLTGSCYDMTRTVSGYSAHKSSEHRQEVIDRISFVALNLETAAYHHLLQILAVTFEVTLPARKFKHDIDVRPDHFSLGSSERTKEFFHSISGGVRTLREKRGLSQKQVADGVNISLSAYRNYEDPSKGIRFGFVLAARYAHFTQIDPRQLVTHTQFGLARKMHDDRIHEVASIIACVEDGDLDFLESYVNQLVTIVEARH